MSWVPFRTSKEINNPTCDSHLSQAGPWLGSQVLRQESIATSGKESMDQDGRQHLVKKQHLIHHISGQGGHGRESVTQKQIPEDSI